MSAQPNREKLKLLYLSQKQANRMGCRTKDGEEALGTLDRVVSKGSRQRGYERFTVLMEPLCP
jgi:hypothetical protein